MILSLRRFFQKLLKPMKLTSMGNKVTLENHCTRKAQSSRGGCSRRVHKKEYLADNKGNILVNILLMKIFIKLLSLINPVVYLLLVICTKFEI